MFFEIDNVKMIRKILDQAGIKATDEMIYDFAKTEELQNVDDTLNILTEQGSYHIIHNTVQAYNFIYHGEYDETEEKPKGILTVYSKPGVYKIKCGVHENLVFDLWYSTKIASEILQAESVDFISSLDI